MSVPDPTSDPASSGGSRYEVLALLGRGGGGSVHLVRDRVTGDRLALKRLVGADETRLQRLKREFRTLANVHHPSLVKLYELGQDEISAYFTMEYLEGQDLREYLEAAWAENDNAAEAMHMQRVLEAFEQLAAAVQALHSAGILHRDLKPSNVMVVAGRVVLLDFGIALELGEGAATITQDKLSSGTPAYMAPEQVRGEHVGEPNDWYAFGVMLYEALSGVLPLDGPVAELLANKLTEDPQPISELVPSVPTAIGELCMALLRRAPEDRPSGEQILSALTEPTAELGRNITLPPHTSRFADDADLSLFGRTEELDTLRQAFARAQSGEPVVVHVFGESGSGKSLLLEHFSDDVASSGFRTSEEQPVVLRSRCYERETLPFKALDGAIDALVEHLSREPAVVASHVLPRNLLALTQLFPQLRSIPAARQILMGATLPEGVSQTRAQAETGLRDMLQRLATLRPVVLWIDDLQWSDVDSIGIVGSWLEPPHIPNFMLVFSYRSEEVSTNPGLQALRQHRGRRVSIERTIALEALRPDHIRALCKHRIERARLDPRRHAQVIEQIVREAHGSPFLASQLVALAIAAPDPGTLPLTRLSLEELVRSRSLTLAPEARRMLHVLSIAGRPISLSLAARAADVAADVNARLHELQSSQLIRTRESAGDRLLEVYHDRLREVVQSLLTLPERRAVERQLMAALRKTGSSDCDWMHTLALATDDREAALQYGLLAAERAGKMLAFERAVELYERCVELSGQPKSDHGELWHKLALAYSYAGHGVKAASTYLHAAQHVNEEQALLFERAAASQLLCSGRFEEGEALLVRVLERLGLNAPSSEAGLYAAIVWERARASMRGLKYKPRTLDETPFRAVYNAELCGLLAIETAVYDPLRAALFQARSLRLALDTGVDELIARALCAAATIASVEASDRAQAHAAALLDKAEALSARIESPRVRTNIVTARAMCAYLAGQFPAFLEYCVQAEHLLRTASGDSEYHHRFSLAACRIATLFELGQFRAGELELLSYLKEAAATENISAELHVCISQAYADSNADRAHIAAERLDSQRKQLPSIGFGILHAVHMIAVLHIGSATERYDWAIDTTREHWRSFERSVVKRSEGFAVFAYEAHARMLIHCAMRGDPQKDLQRALTPHRTMLRKAQPGIARAFLARIDARMSLLQRDEKAAREHVTESMRHFEEASAPDQVARERFALGVLIGGEEGARLQRAALLALSELGVAAPLSQMRGYYPELVARAAVLSAAE